MVEGQRSVLSLDLTGLETAGGGGGVGRGGRLSTVENPKIEI